MSFRYLACAGLETEVADVEARLLRTSDLILRLRCPGVRIFVDPSTPCLVHENGRAVLVGLLIDRASGRRVTELRAGTLPDADFLAHDWGAYVLLQSDADGLLSALRDPSGTVPVFHAVAGSLQLFASDPDTMRLANKARWRADLHFVRHWLSFPFLRIARTGVEGIREILPGTASDGRRDPHVMWSPWAHTQRSTLDFAEAASALRAEILRCVRALVPTDGKVVMQLSGGLDSSILAAALAHSGRRFTAVTFATRAADGDERRYAREVASRFGIELVELVEEDGLPDFARVPAPAFRPPPPALLQPYERLVTQQIRTLGVRWVVNGAGGDNLFASLSSAAPALDALRLDGMRAAAAAIANLAAVHNTTRWHVLRLAWRKARRSPQGSWQREAGFLKSDAALREADPHPWLPPPTSTLPGKREHVLSLIGIQHFLSQDRAGASGLFPLLSQPLLELCLSIPSHFWIAEGRNRAVARVAFRDLVPDLILARRSKGRLESMFMRGYMHGRKQIETLLLDGELRGHDIIDVDAVSAYLRDPGQPRDAGYIRLLEMAAAETWLRSLRT